MSTSDVDLAFHAWLRTQFTTLDEAKAWVHRWCNEWEQRIPVAISAEWGSDDEWAGFSMRAMAAHASVALEGKEYDWDGFTWYLDTKYGPDLYWAMCGPAPEAPEAEPKP
jgi:hypothetical protein